MKLYPKKGAHHLSTLNQSETKKARKNRKDTDTSRNDRATITSGTNSKSNKGKKSNKKAGGSQTIVANSISTSTNI